MKNPELPPVELTGSFSNESAPEITALDEGYEEIGQAYILDGNIQVGNKISTSHTSAVYRGENLEAHPDDCEVAIKVYFDNRPQERLRNSMELAISSGLDNDHLLTSIGQGAVLLSQEDKVLPRRFMVTPLAKKGTLAQMNMDTDHSADDLQRFIYETSLGLEELHKQGLVHRDIKPGNVFLQQNEDGETHALLGDYNFAVPAGTELGSVPFLEEASLVEIAEENINSENSRAVAVGSSGYVSPEQARGTIDQKADIYSLGRTAQKKNGVGIFSRRGQENGYAFDEFGEPQENVSPNEVIFTKPFSLSLTRALRQALSLNPADRPTASEMASAALA